MHADDLQQAASAGADTARIDSVVVESPLPGGVAAIARFLFSSVPQWLQIAGVFIGAIVAAIVVVVLWRRRVQIAAWFRAKSRGWKLGFAAVAVLVLSGAGFAGLQSWNFMMHDNSFCSGCHVMAVPFRKFTASEHSAWLPRLPPAGNGRKRAALYKWVLDRPEGWEPTRRA